MSQTKTQLIDSPINLNGADLTFPSTQGSAGQYLRNSSTAGELEFADGGKILQIVQSTKTDTDSMTGKTFDDLGLSVTITPSSSTSKVLILCSASIGASTGYDVSLRLVKGSTPVFIGDAAGNRTQSTTVFTGNWTTAVYARQNVAINYLDSPATTSATTYKIQARSYLAAGVIYINRGHNDDNLSDYEARAASSIIAMEVAA
jgi:hypothetical protein